MKKKLNFVLIYNFFILSSWMVMFSINVFASIMFIGKNKNEITKNSILKKIKF